MRVKYAFKMAYEALTSDLMRSALTLIGIFLGIMTAVLILGMGKGIILNIENQMSAFGSDKIMIVPLPKTKSLMQSGMGIMLVPFKDSDVSALKTISCISSFGSAVWKRTTITYKNKKIMASVYGVSSDLFDQYSDYLKIDKGREFSDNERNVVVLGYDASHKLFGEDVLPGKHIKIENTTFRVVGVFQKIGTSLSETDDQAIYIPLKTAQKIFGRDNEVDFILLSVREDCDVKEVAKEVELVMARKRGVSVENADFTVITSDYIKEKTDQVLSILYAGSAGVGLIASIVSAIGIANTMFTSVFRRKREIGIMKAIGAKRKDIIIMFLIESVLLSLIGAFLGLLVGILLGVILSSLGIPFDIDIIVFVLAFAIGVVIGILSGLLPAKKASELSPIVAIRA